MRPGLPPVLRAVAVAALLRASTLLRHLADELGGEAARKASPAPSTGTTKGPLPPEVTPEAAALLATPAPRKDSSAAAPAPLPGSLEARRQARELS